MYHHPLGRTASNLHSNTDYTKDFPWPSHKWSSQAKKKKKRSDTVCCEWHIGPCSFDPFFKRFGSSIYSYHCRTFGKRKSQQFVAHRGRWLFFLFPYCVKATKTLGIKWGSHQRVTTQLLLINYNLTEEFNLNRTLTTCLGAMVHPGMASNEVTLGSVSYYNG